MTESMNQLIPIFEDIIKANNFITLPTVPWMTAGFISA